MDIIEKLLDGDLAAHIEDGIRNGAFCMANLISEDLGRGIVAELEPTTGALTLLDCERGVTLDPAQVWLLAAMIEQHKAVWGACALQQVTISMEGE